MGDVGEQKLESLMSQRESERERRETLRAALFSTWERGGIELKARSNED